MYFCFLKRMSVAIPFTQIVLVYCILNSSVFMVVTGLSYDSLLWGYHPGKVGVCSLSTAVSDRKIVGLIWQFCYLQNYYLALYTRIAAMILISHKLFKEIVWKITQFKSRSHLESLKLLHFIVWKIYSLNTLLKSGYCLWSCCSFVSDYASCQKFIRSLCKKKLR